MSRRIAPKLMSSILCKKERGDLQAFRIQVKEDCTEDSLHAISISKDTHRPSSSLNLSESSFNEIGGTNLLPQGFLALLNLFGIQPLFLLRRKFYLIETEQIVDL